MSERRKLAEKILDTLSPMPVSPATPGLTDALKEQLVKAREERLGKIEALLKKNALVWPAALIQAIEEYEKDHAIPPDEFPGHRAFCLANHVGYIGERVAGIYKAQRDTA